MDEGRGFARRLLRRPGPRWALAVLALVYSSAVYAPLVASDRPYYLEGVDLGAYRRDLRVASLAAARLAELLEQGAPDVEAVEAERAALAQRAERLARSLDEVDAAPARELAERAGRAVALQRASTEERGRDEVRALAADIARRGTRLGDELAPRDPRGGDGGAVTLRSTRRFPLLAALRAHDVALLVLWTGLLAAPLWLRRGRGRRRALALVALAVLAGLARAVAPGDPAAAAFETAPYKDALARGELVATRVVFPPLARGFAETRPAEAWRPPSWTGVPMDTRGAERGGDAGARPAEPPPGSPWRHPLGTDSLGRDLLARLLWGGRVSLTVGLASTALLVALGVALGGLAGYCGRWVDALVSRVVEVVQSFPAFFLILTASALVPSEVLHPILAITLLIALVRWTGVARLVRAELLKLRELELTLSARAAGCSDARIVLRHLLPNALGPVLVAAAFSVASGILTESAISFLGLGIQLPVPSWGALIHDSRDPEHWWIQVFPGLAITATVLAYNVLGEGVRDALDPRDEVP